MYIVDEADFVVSKLMMIWKSENNLYEDSGMALAAGSRGIIFLGATLDSSCKEIIETTFKCDNFIYFPRVNDLKNIERFHFTKDGNVMNKFADDANMILQKSNWQQ